jgi:Putative serine esterase (DUF676)
MRLSIAAASAACAFALAPALVVGAPATERAVVVIEGGGAPNAYSTPWDACDSGRPPYVQAMVDAGLPVFTAPGFTNTQGSASGQTGCPPQPPLEVQWNTGGYPTQTGQAVLGLLGYLNATYGYRTFDLVGYSYGGLVARATVAALKRAPAPGTMAPAFSYAQAARAAGVTVPSIVTLNTPHLGGPAYDLATNPPGLVAPVLRTWGREIVGSGLRLSAYRRRGAAGAFDVLVTGAHARRDSASWDSRQVGMLDGVALTLVAGDFCGRTCVMGPNPSRRATNPRLRTDGTVPVYSQLMLPCPSRCPSPPGSVHIPRGMVPAGTVRKTFATIHSRSDTKALRLPSNLSVTGNPSAVDYLVRTVVGTWKAAGVPVAP